MSERDRFSLIGHGGMPLMSPMRLDELASLLAATDLREHDRVVDLGAGRADLGRFVHERYGCVVTSVDRSPAACEAARERPLADVIEVVCQDARVFLHQRDPHEIGLAAALGSLHAWGSGLPSWTRALEDLRPRARWVLVGDLVALGPIAVAAMDVATLGQLASWLGAARERVILPPERVRAYERAWCDAVERYLDAHPGDPRDDWARERIAWSRAPSLESAWSQLAFAALLVPGLAAPV